MNKLSRIVVKDMMVLSNEEMAMINGGDKDPNVCHSFQYDEQCSGSCYQYEGGAAGSCYWNYNTHACQCRVSQ